MGAADVGQGAQAENDSKFLQDPELLKQTSRSVKQDCPDRGFIRKMQNIVSQLLLN
jgi:hypothetical protein